VPAVLAAARRHGVTGLLPDGPDEVGDEVRRFRADARARLARALADLDSVRRAAHAIGAPLVAVKGPVLALSVYPRADARPFADVDVLTSPDAFGGLLGALEAAGGRVLTRNWTAMIRLRSSEVSVEMPAGTTVDVHWNVVNVAWRRDLYRLATADLLAAATQGPVPDIDTLDALSHLGYVCWHFTVSGGVRLLWACDVELAAKGLSGRAGELGEWARRTRTSLPVAVALDYAAVLFPGGAAAALRTGIEPSGWRWANTRVKARVVSRPEGRWSGAFLPLATRTTTWDSLLALRPPPGALVGRRAPAVEDLDVMPIDAGGESGRRAYLDAVARGSL
jgi:hypothetical protein